MHKTFLRMLIALLIFCLLPIKQLNAYSSGNETDEGYQAISLRSLKAHLSFLASDMLEGREAATKGYDIAAGYAASLFQQWNLTPIVQTRGEKNYLQTFSLLEIINKNKETLQLITKEEDSQTTKEFTNRVHFFTNRANTTVSINAPVVFAGYGLVVPEIKYDDFAGIDVKNKIVVVMGHAPGEGDEKTYFYKQENRNRFFNGAEIFEKQKNAQEHGAVAMLLVQDPLGRHESMLMNFATNIFQKFRNNINAPTPRRRMVLAEDNNATERIPIINISKTVSDALFSKSGTTLLELQTGIDKNLKPNSRELTGKQLKFDLEVEHKLLNTTNVVAMLEGSDPNLKNEYVVLGAHLDHDGTRDGYIWNGADDDASGSSAILELAFAFSRAKERPKRSIIFCLWGAEEKGLLGSEYFTDHSPVPLEKITAMVQLDMIGRDVEPRPHQLTNGREKPKDLRRYIYTEISAQSPEMGEILKQANKQVALELNHEANIKVSGGSDHYSFFAKKIPILSIDDGVFHPDYHQPSDTVEKINFEKIFFVTQLTYLISREIANHPSKIKWDESVKVVNNK